MRTILCPFAYEHSDSRMIPQFEHCVNYLSTPSLVSVQCCKSILSIGYHLCSRQVEDGLKNEDTRMQTLASASVRIITVISLRRVSDDLVEHIAY